MPEPRAIVSDKAVRPVQNNTGSELVTNSFVTIDPAGLDDPPDAILPALGGKVYGVVITSKVRVDTTPNPGIEDGEIGDVQVEDRVQVLSSAAIALDANIATTAAGLAVTAVATNLVVGKALTAATGASELIEVELTGAAQSFVL